MNKQVCIIVFTDLDGTLLDHYTYSFSPARKALKILKDHNIPLIFCSSKTSKEMIMWRKRLKNEHPFIVENGGAVYIPEGYFFNLPKNKNNSFINNYSVFVLSRPGSEIIKIIKKIKKEYPCEIRYLSEMTPAEISKNTGLPLVQARYAKARNYNEPCVVHDISGKETKLFLQAIHREGIRWTHGDRFTHFMSGSDKGKAVQWLTRLYKKNNPERKIISIGIGDSLNDLPMLKAVDYPCIVQKYNGRYDPALRDNYFYRAGKSGPEGWQRAVMRCFKRLRAVTD